MERAPLDRHRQPQDLSSCSWISLAAWRADGHCLVAPVNPNVRGQQQRRFNLTKHEEGSDDNQVVGSYAAAIIETCSYLSEHP